MTSGEHSPRRGYDAEPKDRTRKVARDRRREERCGACCVETAGFRCFAAPLILGTAVLVLYAGSVTVGRQQRRALELVRGQRRWTRSRQVTDGVWTGVSSVRSSIPQLCRSGPELVCSSYEAVVVLGGGPANKDGSLPEWVKRRCDGEIVLIFPNANAPRCERGLFCADRVVKRLSL